MNDTLQTYYDKHNYRLPTEPIPDETKRISTSKSIEEIKAICAKIHDVIFMKQSAYIELINKMGNPLPSDTDLIRGYVGTLNEIQVIVYDDINKEDLLNDYAMNFYQQSGREPSILLVK